MIKRVHSELQRRLEEAGGRLDRIEVSYAPPWLGWLADRTSVHALRRRKPRPGMLEDAVSAWRSAGEEFDAKRAVMVGDTIRDAGAAAAFGIPCILLATTYSEPELRRQLEGEGLEAKLIVPDLSAAVDRTLEDAA